MSHEPKVWNGWISVIRAIKCAPGIIKSFMIMIRGLEAQLADGWQMLVKVDNTSHEVEMSEAVYLILANHPDHLQPIGTGFAIGRYLLVTAAHVFDDTTLTGRGSYAIRFRPTGAHGTPILWSHARFEGIYDTRLDLGLGIIAPPDPAAFPLDFTPPAVGDTVLTLGFPDTQYSYRDGENIINVNPAAATGTIIEFHPEIRDSVMCPFPCYTATMQVPGGLSGGPVFGRSGGVIGVNVSSFSGTLPTCTFVPITPILLARLPDPPFGDDALLDDMGPPPWPPNSMVLNVLNAGEISSTPPNCTATVARIENKLTLHVYSPAAATPSFRNREQRRRLAQRARAEMRRKERGEGAGG